MRRETNGKRNSGFTLVEMLAVTAIVVILLAVGMVSVVRYARWLEITELDNTAREIYLAAENRAVLLSAGGRLNTTEILWQTTRRTWNIHFPGRLQREKSHGPFFGPWDFFLQDSREKVHSVRGGSSQTLLLVQDTVSGQIWCPPMHALQ